MIRILNIEPEDYAREAYEILERLGTVEESCLGRGDLLAQLPQYDVLIVRLGSQIDREIIEAGSRLRAIVTATTGLDHIDLEFAKTRGVAVLGLKGETEFLRSVGATAEHTWALLLALMRRIPSAIASVLEGEWNRLKFRGRELHGKRLGIVGLGRIGRQIAGYGKAFGMLTAAFDPYTSKGIEGVRRIETLHALLRQSDVLSLHVPLNRDTTGLIGRKELGLLPGGALLINTSRGEILDEIALFESLRSGEVGGAALDVVCNERDEDKRQQSPLLAYAREHNNLLITPHIGGATRESMWKTEIFMAQKLEKFLTTSIARVPIKGSVSRGI